MPALLFDGVDDRLRWTTLAAALGNVSNGPWTCAALVKRNTFTTFDAVAYLNEYDGVEELTQAGCSILDTDVVGVDVGALLPKGTATIANNDVRIVCASKGAGSVAPRGGIKNLTAGSAWTHEAFSSALADQVAANRLEIAVWISTGDPFDGWIGLVGFWEGAMSDAQKEELSTNARTSDWWSHSFGQPMFLAELNVAAASVVDLAANASATAHVGTTLDGAETLAGWNFNGIGGAAPPPTVPVLPQVLMHGARSYT